MMRREPDESLEAFKVRRILRFGAAFRDQAAIVRRDWPDVAASLELQAVVAERAAGLMRFRALELATTSTVN